MKIAEDSVITLDDGLKYVYVNETNYENERYILFMGIEEDEETLREKDIIVAKEAEENGELFIDQIVDEELLTKVVPLLVNN